MKKLTTMTAAAILTFALNIAKANGNLNAPILKEKKVNFISLTPVSANEEFTLIKLSMIQPAGEKGILEIKDGTGELFYSENINDTIKVLLLKVNPSEVDNLKIALRNATGTLRKSYNIEKIATTNYAVELKENK